MGPLRTDIVNISTRKCHGKVSESAFSVTTMHRLRKNSAELGFFVIGMLQCMGESFSATFIRIAHWETWPQNLSFLYKGRGFHLYLLPFYFPFITLRTSKFRNHFTISSKYFDMSCYLK